MTRPDERDRGLEELLDEALASWRPSEDARRVSVRGRRRRAGRLAASVLVVVTFVGVMAWAADRVGEGSTDTPATQNSAMPAPGTWSEGDRRYERTGEETLLVDSGEGFRVTYPNSWIAADERINTWVSSPREILALATYPLRPGGEAVIDAQVPSHAMEDLGPDDAFIWVNDGGEGGDDLPVRPVPFEPAAVCGAGPDLCPEPDGRRLGIEGVHAWWLYFQDQGRLIYVFVAVGEEAFQDPTLARAPWTILDSLVLEPR
jgi:hypothetical protein